MINSLEIVTIIDIGHITFIQGKLNTPSGLKVPQFKIFPESPLFAYLKVTSFSFSLYNFSENLEKFLFAGDINNSASLLVFLDFHLELTIHIFSVPHLTIVFINKWQ